MEKHTLVATWLGNVAFESEITGHKIITDLTRESGGEDKGYSPKRLMLMALAGCTGIDVASIIAKMKLEVSSFRILIEADVTDNHPKYYESMHVVFEFTGKELPPEKLKRAVELSEEKYCGVMAVYKKAIRMSSEIRILEQ
jgi:putative redox protein